MSRGKCPGALCLGGGGVLSPCHTPELTPTQLNCLVELTHVVYGRAFILKLI